MDIYNLGDFAAIADPFSDVEEIDIEDRGGSSSANASPPGIAARRLLGLQRDAHYTGVALPGHRHVPVASTMSDADLLSSIDRVALHSALRLGSVGVRARATINEAAVSKVLLSTARAIGVAPWRMPSPTLDMLKHDLSRDTSPAYERLTSRQRNEAVGAVGAALMTMDNVLRLPGSTQIAPLFAPTAWEKLSSACRISGAADDRVERGLDLVEARASAMVATARQARSFTVALNEARQYAGLSIEQLAVKSGIPTNKLRNWSHGETPRKDRDGSARALEEALGLPGGSLGALIDGEPGRRETDEVLTDRVRRYLKAGGIPLGILPDDWSTLARSEKKRIVAWIRTFLVHGSPYRAYQRAISRAMHESEEPILHKPLPCAIATCFANVKEFKTVRIPQRTGFSRRHAVRQGRRTRVNGGRWRETTTAPLVESEVKRLVTAFDAMGNAREDLRPGIFISADALRAATELIAERRCENMEKADLFKRFKLQKPADNRFYVAGDVNRLLMVRGLFNTNTGYLYHNKPALSLLDNADGTALIDDDFIKRADADWKGVVIREWEAIGRYADELADEVQALRDPSFGIQPILDLESPYQALIDARDRMEDDRPRYLGSPVAAARHDRNHCLVALTIAACPRRRNIGPLTYRKNLHGEDAGHLRRNRETNHFELHIPKNELKNEHSRALPPGDTLVIVLDPEDTRLYRSIERWVIGRGCSRDVLHGDDAGDHLFPGQKGGGLCDHMVAQVIYKFSARYLVKTPWRLTGFEGVLPFGPHAIRDIVATHVLRVTGSLEAAAAAIYDTVETVEKRYAHLAARDRGIRNIINIRLGLRTSEDPLRDRLLAAAMPLKLGLRVDDNIGGARGSAA